MSHPGAPVSSARTVRCQACGGDIPIQSLAPAVQCPHCRQSQPLDPATVQELHQYQAQAAAHIEEARGELQQAAAWQHVGGRPGSRPVVNTLVAFGLMGGLPMVVALGGAAAASAGVIAPEHQPFIGFAATGSAMVGVVLYMVWYYGGKRKSVSVQGGGAGQVTCPCCGAPNSLQMGQVLEACGHCGAALMPSATVMQAGLEAAHQVVRRAQMERYRAERAGMAQVSSYNMSGAVPYFIMGSFAMMIVPITAIFAVQMATGEEPFDPSIFIVGAFAVALVGAIAGLVVVRRRRKALWRSVTEQLAAQIGGQVTGGLDGNVRWLNAYWAGPYELTNLMAGNYGTGAAGAVAGFPTLFFVDPVRSSEYYPAKMHVFVAAWIPGVSDGTNQGARHTQESMTLVQFLRERYFDVEVQEAGILARATPHLVTVMRKSPESTTLLLETASAAARIAQTLGASPVAPLG